MPPQISNTATIFPIVQAGPIAAGDISIPTRGGASAHEWGVRMNLWGFAMALAPAAII
jgi:hypothetical protein